MVHGIYKGPISDIPQAYYDGTKKKFAEALLTFALSICLKARSKYISDLTGPLADYARDLITYVALRDPIVDEVEAWFIGGGFSALAHARAPARAGCVESIRIVERGADVGGTWYWNRYPGAACDVWPAYPQPAAAGRDERRALAVSMPRGRKSSPTARPSPAATTSMSWRCSARR